VGAAWTEIAIPRSGVARMGFFTDTTTCIGCKACEVACKQWNDLPGDELREGRGRSYDYTGELSASTWRHVRFVETTGLAADGGHLPALPAVDGDADMPSLVDVAAGRAAWDGLDDGAALDRWVFMSDVCKHCSNAGCLDACPTGALIRTEFQTVIVQPDICNGCGYCVPSCPFGVIDRDPYDGRAAKCTLCYDRLEDGMEPACAKACPTDAIQFGEWDELVERAKGRVVALHERGIEGAYLYGAGDEPGEQLAGDLGAFFLLTEPPERFGLPAKADSPIQQSMPVSTVAGLAAGAVAAAVTVASFVVAHRRGRRR
jgi:formate dehydrogenase iron-sulfur subunit